MMKTWFGKEPLITPKWIARGKYHWEVSSEKAKQELGLEKTSLDEGLKKTIEWFKTR